MSGYFRLRLVCPVGELSRYRKSTNDRFAPIVLKKSFLGDEGNVLGPLMLFALGDLRTTSSHPKTTTDLRISAREALQRWRGLKSAFARFSGSLDFRLFQQYPPEAEPSSHVAFDPKQRQASAIAPPNPGVSVLAFRLMMVRPRSQSQTRHD